ncbi:creatininase family protein [Pseudonocardia sp.]|uniref:creatininase family protein n=1 Tax=Pseudonocardia sp. TaxID=60912 RepID=UPI003D1254DE
MKIAHMSWRQVQEAIDREALVILPTGATEAHGAHMPNDADTHQAEHVATLVAQRLDAVVAPPLPYGISKTFESFSGTVSLSVPLYQELVYEIGTALIKQGFRKLLILNGNRPNGTANDAVARRLIDDLDTTYAPTVTAVSYWEPAAARIHALRRSEVGGMGHGCEFETSFQLAVRPELVDMAAIEGVTTPLVGWDLVAPVTPSRTYTTRPSPSTNDTSIFGDPHVASAESGRAFLDAVVEELVAMMTDIQPSYGDRRVPAGRA